MKMLNALLVSLICVSARAVLYDAMPEAAKELFPKGKPVVVSMNDGRELEGIATEETSDRMMLQTRQSSGIWMARPILKSAVKSIRNLEMDTLWGERMLEFSLSETGPLPEERYGTAIARFEEYLKACPDAEHAATVRERKADFERELVALKAGQEKVAGEWLTPVRAAVRWFDLYSTQIETLKKRPDSRSNPRVVEAIEKVTTDRREVVRKLPRLTKDRVELLVSKGQFEEPVAELNAFIDFWLQQVLQSEASVSQAFGQMDFSYVSELQELIMRTYRESAEARNPKRPSRAVPADMAFVPGGYVLVGDPSAKLGQPEFPSRVVYVSPFLIDKYEVSNAQYRQFVEYVQRTRDESMEHPDAPPLKKHDAKGWETPGLAGDDQPVVGVDWFDAYAYAKWKKKRLPTEAEWEKAARGLDGRMYPWGEESPEQQAANYDEGRRHLAREMDRQNPPKAVEQKGGGGCFRKSEPPPPPPPTMLPKTTWPVKMALAPQATKAVDRDELTWKRSTVNAYGCLHMAGNAAEWVADYYEKEAYVRMDARNPQGPASGTFRAYRGGSYLSQRAPELLAYRRWGAIKATQGGTTQGREAFIGFRCVIPLE